MKTAFSVLKERIAPVFDVSSNILLRETDDGKLISEKQFKLPPASVFSRAAFMAENKVEKLVCGALSREAAEILDYFQIKCCPFISGDIDDVVSAYEQNRLQEKHFLMPGCGRRNKCRKKVYRPGYRQKNYLI